MKAAKGPHHVPIPAYEGMIQPSLVSIGREFTRRGMSPGPRFMMPPVWEYRLSAGKVIQATVSCNEISICWPSPLRRARLTAASVAADAFTPARC